jgi:anti-sigma B factor antagonist
MNITNQREGNQLTVALEGKLDTASAPQLEAFIKEELSGVDLLVLDLAKLKYTSSAGLRTIVLAQKTMNKQGKMILKNVGEDIMDVFDMTGLLDLLTIE